MDRQLYAPWMGDQDPKNWSFFKKEPYELDKNLQTETQIRFAANHSHHCKFFYIGKLITQLGKHSVVKFSNYEGRRILQWVTPILDQIDSYHGE